MTTDQLLEYATSALAAEQARPFLVATRPPQTRRYRAPVQKTNGKDPDDDAERRMGQRPSRISALAVAGRAAMDGAVLGCAIRWGSLSSTRRYLYDSISPRRIPPRAVAACAARRWNHSPEQHRRWSPPRLYRRSGCRLKLAPQRPNLVRADVRCLLTPEPALFARPSGPGLWRERSSSGPVPGFCPWPETDWKTGAPLNWPIGTRISSVG